MGLPRERLVSAYAWTSLDHDQRVPQTSAPRPKEPTFELAQLSEPNPRAQVSLSVYHPNSTPDLRLSSLDLSSRTLACAKTISFTDFLPSGGSQVTRLLGHTQFPTRSKNPPLATNFKRTGPKSFVLIQAIEPPIQNI
ncbi:hypothetical protein FNV43_RR16961 [Rhamnella rubrinervis]|uniref:Uncharacterized protein n=1 Tax=Rhamnella rubrinervis TaxID=2594499 RepID=A0A8K0GZT9_9ROSA|nr:hypothetical protein FNV43_RR16961 [Rhamnella rubrinervis]